MLGTSIGTVAASRGGLVSAWETRMWSISSPRPANIRDQLAKDFRAALNAPAAKARFTDLGAAPVGSSPAEFGAFIRAEYERWGPIIKAAGIKPE